MTSTMKRVRGPHRSQEPMRSVAGASKAAASLRAAYPAAMRDALAARKTKPVRRVKSGALTMPVPAYVKLMRESAAKVDRAKAAAEVAATETPTEVKD